MSNEETCPHCNADLRDGKIPEEHKESYGDKEYFSRLIGLEDDSYDGVSYWCCPECWTVWNRWSGEINETMHEEEWFGTMMEAEHNRRYHGD